jgi:hypothetical protein
MASDDVMTLLDKGEVFFLDVREPSELEEMGARHHRLKRRGPGCPCGSLTRIQGYRVMAFCGFPQEAAALGTYPHRRGMNRLF